MTAGRPMQGNSTSTVLGRRLGAELIKIRTAAGMTQPQAAKTLTASTAKVAKMERGWVPIRDPDIRALCELYGVTDPATIGSLLELARVDRDRRKAKGWWNDFPGLGDMQEYVALESAATTIKAWQLSFVPGLLQTPDYMRALRSSPSLPQADASDGHFVAVRLTRQRRLTEAPRLTFRTVIFESALRNLMGGASVMRDQLRHLADQSGEPNVSVQVLPFTVGSPHGLDCAFNIISFAEPGAMDVVYREVPFTRQWVEGGEGAVQHEDLFERIAGNALSRRDSQLFIRDLAEGL